MTTGIPNTPVQRPPAEAPAQPPRAVIDRFRATKTWTRIMATTGVTISALVLLAAVFILLRALIGNGQPLLVIVAFAVAVASVVYALPAIALLRYSRAMETAIRNPTIASVENALRTHKTFWNVIGVITVIVVVAQAVSISRNVVVPNVDFTTARSKETRTIADVKAFGEALEAYAKDHHVYPEAGTLQDVRPYLEPRYIAKLPMKDGWGHDLVYVSRCRNTDCFDVAVMSLGSDGERDPYELDQIFGYRQMPKERPLPLKKPVRPGLPVPEETSSEPTAADVIYSNGRMVQPAPEAQQ